MLWHEPFLGGLRTSDCFNIITVGGRGIAACKTDRYKRRIIIKGGSNDMPTIGQSATQSIFRSKRSHRADRPRLPRCIVGSNREVVSSCSSFVVGRNNWMSPMTLSNRNLSKQQDKFQISVQRMRREWLKICIM